MSIGSSPDGIDSQDIRSCIYRHPVLCLDPIDIRMVSMVRRKKGEGERKEGGKEGRKEKEREGRTEGRKGEKIASRDFSLKHARSMFSTFLPFLPILPPVPSLPSLALQQEMEPIEDKMLADEMG